MRAILINPMQESIRYTSYDGDFRSIYRILQCTTYEAVYPFDNGDTLWIDEEGLLKESNYAFNLISDKLGVSPKSQFGQTIMGSALILGTDAEGESIECKSKLDDIKSRVTFQGKVAIENDGQGFTITPWHIYQNNLEEARLLLEKLKTEGSA
tara:strand:- start:1333 stop:1791 length:459 start_codon:yes stop_codon:yes gene_type:complete